MPQLEDNEIAGGASASVCI